MRSAISLKDISVTIVSAAIVVSAILFSNFRIAGRHRENVLAAPTESVPEPVTLLGELPTDSGRTLQTRQTEALIRWVTMGDERLQIAEYSSGLSKYSVSEKISSNVARVNAVHAHQNVGKPYTFPSRSYLCLAFEMPSALSLREA